MRRPQRGTLLKLALPEGARLVLRKRAGETTYLPVRVEFPDDTTTTHWESVLEAYGVDVSDWEVPRIVERSTF